MQGSWKTTTAGVIAIIAAVSVALNDQSQGYAVDWGPVTTAIIAAVGLFLARDKDVSSEQQAGKKTSKSKILPFLLLPMLFVVGCSTANSNPNLGNEAKEENSGWTDADNSGIRVIVKGDVIRSSIEVWVETTSGNARAGKGADSKSTSGATTQSPENTTTTDVTVPLTGS